MRLSNEIKTGIVILAAVAVGVIFFARTASFQTGTYPLKTYFRYAGDLKEDAVVKLSGIEAGRVKSIKFMYDPDTRVECLLLLNRGVRVRKDSIAYIGTAGFVGDAYVGITPGGSPDFLEPRDTVASEDPIQMRELMKKADKIADGLDSTLQEIRSLASNVNGVVTDNRQGIDNIVANMESTAQNFKEFSEDVKSHPWKLLFKGE
ncbi:MAG: MCE family protein [Candidatus Omnitrophica bacterium]|nr:MCE family protein [Candidatus Omnitrophota bacterium]